MEKYQGSREHADLKEYVSKMKGYEREGVQSEEEKIPEDRTAEPEVRS